MENRLKKRRTVMDVNRRQFIQITGATAAGLAVGGLGFDLKPVKAHAGMLKTKYAKETTTICCYCAVGCGAIVHTSKRGDGRVLNIEGDPDHVINRGALCSKGASLKQLAENENRLTQPMYRAPICGQMAIGFLGLGPGKNRPPGEGDPRCFLHFKK
jgi:formate dehydrogenase major subunit